MAKNTTSWGWWRQVNTPIPEKPILSIMAWNSQQLGDGEPLLLWSRVCHRQCGNYSRLSPRPYRAMIVVLGRNSPGFTRG